MGKPSQFATGFPDGIGRSGDEGVSVTSMGVFVGGTAVLVGSSVGVGVLVGSDMAVKVGKLVAVGTGIWVGFGAKALQDVNAKTSTEKNMILLIAFMFPLSSDRLFWIKRPN
jgi:hypothetical protein